MFIVKILYFAIAQYVWRLRYSKRHSVHGSEGVNNCYDFHHVNFRQ